MRFIRSSILPSVFGLGLLTVLAWGGQNSPPSSANKKVRQEDKDAKQNPTDRQSNPSSGGKVPPKDLRQEGLKGPDVSKSGLRGQEGAGERLESSHPETAYEESFEGTVVDVLPYFLVIRIDKTGDFRRFEYAKFTTFRKEKKEIPDTELASGMHVRVDERKDRQLLKVSILKAPLKKEEFHTKRVRRLRGTLTDVIADPKEGGPTVAFQRQGGSGYLAYSLHRGTDFYVGKSKVGTDEILKGMPAELVFEEGVTWPKAVLATKAGDKLDTDWFYKKHKLEPISPQPQREKK